MVTSKQAGSEPAGPEPLQIDDEVTVDEVTERYYGQWVFMEVSEYDEDHWPRRGRLIAHAPTHAELNDVMKGKIAQGAVTPDKQYTSFCAFPIVRSGPDFEAASAEFASGLILAMAKRGSGGSDAR